MKRKLLKLSVVFTAVVLAVCSMNASVQDYCTVFDTGWVDVEALASSEKGCISKSDKNNGNCTTDGTSYFCENSWMFHDCVKGDYPD